MTAPGAALPRSPWLVSPAFDLAFFFGGAGLGAGSALAVLLFGVPVTVVWWIWLLGFDGPHMMATYSRTYLDNRSWREQPKLLLGTLAAFAVGPLAVLMSGIAGRDEPFLLFVAVATGYGYYHVTRQHWGFLALYRTRRADRSRAGFLVDKWGLYVGCWAPYAAFLITHDKTRPLLGLAGSAPAWLALPFIAAWIACLSLILVRALRERAGGLQTVYAAVVLLLHGAAYFIVARFEPVYSASSGPDEDFLLLTVMLSTFHATEYIALVYIHNRSRYAPASSGAASWLSKTAARFLLVCLGFSVAYLFMASSTGVFPVIRSFAGKTVGGMSVNRLALSLWWGLALHHYVIDQRIWRIKEDPELRKHLGLATWSQSSNTTVA